MKRYIVFAFLDFEGCRGWSGAVGHAEEGRHVVHSFDTIEEARAVADDAYKTLGLACTQIVDLHTGRIVEGNE